MPLQHNNSETTQKFISTLWADRIARNLYLFQHDIFSLENHIHNPLPKDIKHQAPNFIKGSKNMKNKTRQRKFLWRLNNKRCRGRDRGLFGTKKKYMVF